MSSTSQLYPVVGPTPDVQLSKPSPARAAPHPAVPLRFLDETKERKDENMGDKKNELSFEGDLPVEKVVAYLRELADGFESGSVPVQSGSNRVVLRPGKSLAVQVRAKVKKRESSLKLELGWEQGSESELRIGSE